mmetsp:Transcript_13252/g.55554  ORF Transcript_13252/g.55554 Transcript_13252/m.55554 type:complete len:213 (+) Transcript_13252:942-1580(+)
MGVRECQALPCAAPRCHRQGGQAAAARVQCSTAFQLGVGLCKGRPRGPRAICRTRGGGRAAPGRFQPAGPRQHRHGIRQGVSRGRTALRFASARRRDTRGRVEPAGPRQYGLGIRQSRPIRYRAVRRAVALAHRPPARRAGRATHSQRRLGLLESGADPRRGPVCCTGAHGHPSRWRFRRSRPRDHRLVFRECRPAGNATVRSARQVGRAAA